MSERTGKMILICRFLLLFLTGLLLGVIVATIVTVVRQAFFTAWECRDQICMDTPQSQIWAGHADYIRQTSEEIIVISKELGIFRQNPFPLYLYVESPLTIRFKRALAGSGCWIRCNLIFDKDYLASTDRAELDNTIAHELAHLFLEFGTKKDRADHKNHGLLHLGTTLRLLNALTRKRALGEERTR